MTTLTARMPRRNVHTIVGRVQGFRWQAGLAKHMASFVLVISPPFASGLDLPMLWSIALAFFLPSAAIVYCLPPLAYLAPESLPATLKRAVDALRRVAHHG